MTATAQHTDAADCTTIEAATAAPVDASCGPDPRASRVHSAAIWSGLLLVLLLHSAFIACRFAPAIATPDANGYWAQATLLYQTGRTWFEPETDPQYIGMHWLVTDDGRYFSRYPPGLPLLIGAAHSLFGPVGALCVNPAFALLALVGLFLFLRPVVGPAWALFGTATLALNPTFCRHALNCDSHMAVTCFLVWGGLFLTAWGRDGSYWQIFVAGVLLGAIPTIRYPEVLVACGVGAYLLCYWRDRPKIWRHYAVALAGALIPIIPLLIRNQRAFGAFWRTAYSLTNEQSGFAWSYFQAHFANYVRQLHGDGCGLLFPLGVIGLVMMCGVRKYRPAGLLLVLATVPITLLYMAYYWAPNHGHGSMTMRFVLPTFVCYVTGAVYALAQIARSMSAAMRAALAAAVILLQAVWGWSGLWEDTKLIQHRKAVLAAVTEGLRDAAKPGDVVLADRQVLQHLDFLRTWRLVDTSALRGGGGRRLPGLLSQDPDAPAPMQAAKAEIQSEKYAGLERFSRERQIAWDVRSWAADGDVYFVASEEEFERLRGHYFGADRFEIVARVPLPKPPKMPQKEGMMGAGMRRPDNAPAPLGGAPGVVGMHPVRGQDPMSLRGDAAPPMGLRRRGPMGRWNSMAEAEEFVIARWTWNPDAAGPATDARGWRRPQS